VLASLDAAHPMAELRAGQTFDARLMVLPSFGPACDLHGLGMLLFRTLLVHDAQTAEEVHAVVRRCIDRLELDVAGRADAARFCRDHLLRAVREHDAVFKPSSLLWRRDDRADSLAGFPRLLWQEILLFAFRLATTVPGFSFADSHADTHPQNPGMLGEQVSAEVRALLGRVHVELFAREARDRELAEVCGDLLTELRGQLVAGALDAGRGPPAVTEPKKKRGAP
jgi:hypothetical protein